MSKPSNLIIVGLFAVTLGCGSNSGSGTTATGGSRGGASASGGSGSGGSSASASGGNGGGTSGTATGGTGGGTGTSSCVLPSCLKNLGAGCAESGTCVTQTDQTNGNTNTCYSNGVKEITIHDINTDDRAMTVTNGTKTCFSTAFNGNDVYGGSGGIITVKDASGATVADVMYDDTLSFYLVTCTGAQQVATDPSCLTVWPASILMGSQCPDGTCTP